MRATGAWATNLQVYAPRGGTTICVEPVSHASDAANRLEAAAHGAMHVVEQGARIVGELTLRWD
jgi:aldose 1-epimerase